MVGTHLSQQVYSLINYIQVYVHVASSPGLSSGGGRGLGTRLMQTVSTRPLLGGRGLGTRLMQTVSTRPLLGGEGPGDEANVNSEYQASPRGGGAWGRG